MVLSRFTKHSSNKLEQYWLRSPFMTFVHVSKDMQWVYKVFTYYSTTAETIELP